MIMKVLYLDTTENKIISSLPGITFQQVNADFEAFCNNLVCSEEDIILINAEMIKGDTARYSEFSGVLLLKWLRIYKRLTNKIIIFGLIPLKSIIESHPEHIILMAAGTSYLQFPFTKEELNLTLGATRPIEKEKLVELYCPFVKADFNIEQIRHSFANEFGLYLMQMIHNYIAGKEMYLKVNSAYGTLDFKKASFLYSPSISSTNYEQARATRADLQNTIGQQDSKILYIDDQATLGWDYLLCDMIFGSETNSGFVVLSNGNQFGEGNVFRTINREKPGCVLLDLRLKGDIEKDLPIEEISGYKLLLKIKDKFPSLPVIIVSATNKADNLRALTKARAEGLWTKPRVEFIHNSSYLVDSYLNLLRLVYEALTKYKTPLEKTIFKLNFQVLHSKPINFADDFFSKSQFIFDTNYFICSNKDYNGYYNRLYYFILLCETIKQAKKKNRIIISQDILLELFIHSGKRLPQDAKQEALDVKFSSKYALDLIFRISNSGSNVIETNFDREFWLKSATVSYNISKGGSGKRFELTKKRIEFVDFFDSRDDAEDNKNKLIEKDKMDILHADDTLKLLANYYFVKKESREINNNYFISDDLTCNYNVYNYIKKSNTKITFTNINSIKQLFSPDGMKLKRATLRYLRNGSARNIFIYQGSKFVDELKKNEGKHEPF